LRDVGFRVGEDFEESGCDLESGVFDQGGDRQRQGAAFLCLGEGKVDVDAAAVGAGEDEAVDDAQRFEGLQDATNRKGVALRVIGTSGVDVDEGVVGFFAEADAVEECALFDEAIAQRMASLRLPLDGVPWLGVGCPDVVEAVREEGEEGVRSVFYIEEVLGRMGSVHWCLLCRGMLRKARL